MAKSIEKGDDEISNVNATEAEERVAEERQQNATNHEMELIQRVKILEEKSIDDNQRLENARDEIHSLKEKILELEESLIAQQRQANESASQQADLVDRHPSSCGLQGLEEILKSTNVSQVLRACSESADKLSLLVATSWQRLRVQCLDWFAIMKLHLTTALREVKDKLSRWPTPDAASSSTGGA